MDTGPCPSFCSAYKYECLELLQLIPWHTTSLTLHPPPTTITTPSSTTIIHCPS
ncbi:hypothetical protein HanXRQr2_Chr06g0272261 [Helianthus annuus]|uniref:Uncharacterized protein n=1 Tax=Helianthus annuus TaxID=4232 RepID=A0A9K3IUY8_HELAN|nr:hypothetical protein HanXRQr2_Chr06g0272261 [Helianthus annuus]KAJ0916540.1 hypothetical protein HanPSC8_Chr06g0262851 [Helianthus annuus]